MPEAVSSIGELHRNKWIAIIGIVTQSIRQNIIHKHFPNAQWEELMNDDPLVVPSYQPSRFIENL